MDILHKSSNYSWSYLKVQRNDVLIRVKIISVLYKALHYKPSNASCLYYALALENKAFIQRLCSLRSIAIASTIMVVEQVSTSLQVKNTRLFKNTSTLIPGMPDWSTVQKSINIMYRINKEQKLHDHPNSYRKSIGQNPAPFHDKKHSIN